MDETVFMKKKKKGFLSSYITNPKERLKVTITLGIVTILLIGSIGYITYSYQNELLPTGRPLKELMKNLGSIARIGFFATLAIYPIFFLLKWKPMKNISFGNIKAKTILQFVGKYARQWHVPVAIVSTSIIIVHSLLAILKGFEWGFTYLSGITSLSILFVLLYMGLQRYKKADKQWHFRMAVSFLVVFGMHFIFA